MGTRSNIGIQNEDGSVLGIYCHWDGYPSNNGVLLRDNYTTAESVKALLAEGDMSSLGDSVDECTFYRRDRGEDYVDAIVYDSVEDLVENGEEYIYVFTKDGSWIVSDHGNTPVDLDSAIAADS